MGIFVFSGLENISKHVFERNLKQLNRLKNSCKGSKFLRHGVYLNGPWGTSLRFAKNLKKIFLVVFHQKEYIFLSAHELFKNFWKMKHPSAHTFIFWYLLVLILSASDTCWCLYFPLLTLIYAYTFRLSHLFVLILSASHNYLC